MIRIEEYLTEEGKSPFGQWFGALDARAAALVTVAELRIDRGPGYRVYFGWDGKTLVILLGGGTKRRRQNDIEKALKHWRPFKARKVRVGRK
jgi:hypothetical protein